MSGALSTVRPGRMASRYAALGIGLVGIAGFGAVLTLFFWDRHEQATHLDLEIYHMGSSSLASKLAADLTHMRSEIEELDASEIASRLDFDATLAGARIAVDRLEALQQSSGTPEVASVLQAVVARFDRFVSVVDRAGLRGSEPHRDALHPALDSLYLAVEQLQRLHAIEARVHLVEIATASARRNRVVVLTAGLFLAGVVAAGLWTLTLLRRTFAQEEELRASLERARRNQQRAIKMEALGRLAGGVAHDFNNLLTVVLGHCEQIQESLDGESPLTPEVQGIQRAVDHAAALTRQLLTFSRSGSSEPKVIDLNELTRGVELLLSRLLGGRCSLVTSLSPGLGLVRVDPREVERVLVNLVSNAGDAMPNGGAVAIETVNIRAKPPAGSTPGSDADEQDSVRLSVSDTGTGMDDETLDRILEPFFTTKAEDEGTGIGLSTVHGIVTKANGWVEVESEVGIGTRVNVYLPHYEHDPEDDLEPEVPDRGQPSETILLVEDEPGIRRSLARGLRGGGYTVLESADGSAALELFSEHRESIDLILTDVVMPGMTGPELVEHAKLLQPQARVLFMSGYPGAELPPGTRLLAKPFRCSDLLSEVRSSLGQC